VPSLSVSSDIGPFDVVMSMLGELSGLLPPVLSVARQYVVEPDEHLDAYNINRQYTLSWEKDQQAHLDYSVNWSRWLADVPGDSISNMYVGKTDGIAVTAQGIVNGAITAVMAKDGVIGITEAITIKISTTRGRSDERTIRLFVRER
jgi:hypothetical protein